MLKYCIIIIIIQHCILKINRDDEVAFSVKKNPKQPTLHFVKVAQSSLFHI